MTVSEFYTSQFYTWEYRGRGWYVSECPIQLEPPFIPFYRHGYGNQSGDDGKRHTLISKFIENISSKKKIEHQQDVMDYESIEVFPSDDDIRLTALQIKTPKERKIVPEKMKALLVMLSYVTTQISFEIIGTESEIIIQLVCDEKYSDTIETYVKAFFPNYSILASSTYLDTILRDDLATTVVDFGLRHEFVRPLATAKGFAMDPLIGAIGVLERLGHNEQAGIQILFQPAVNAWSDSIRRSVTMEDGTSFFIDTPDAPQLAQEKVHSPLYGVTIRTFSQAEDLTHAFHIHERISFSLVHASKSQWNELLPLSNEEYDFEARVTDILRRQSHRHGMLLNLDELITLAHIPSESIVSKKLFAIDRKTKKLPTNAQGKAFVLGENIHNGESETVTFSLEDRLKHTHIIGATGTGKSTLIANIFLQDVEAGHGIVLFDPHGDLIEDIISRVPEHRIHDIVLIDPSDNEFPIGLNILQAGTEVEKEVLSSDLVSTFKKFATSWGDQMSAVLGNAILAILEHPEGGTLHDLRRFLIEKEFRTFYLKNVRDPSVLYYWQKEYPFLKSNSIGPILTRLDTFLRPRSIRNMVVQKKGLDFEALLNTNKIILIKLSQGLIGTENSYLLGSLLLSKIHQTVLSRQQQSIRNPVFIYLDEFQNFITPSVKEMISGIRKYNVGLVLSHQDLQQLQQEDSNLVHTILGNINTRIVFRVGEPDAKRLQDGFSNFDFTDLQNLGRGEAVIRIEQPQFDCSLDTIQLRPISGEQRQIVLSAVVANTRKHYATSKDEVESILFESFHADKNTEPAQHSKSRKYDQNEAKPAEKPLQAKDASNKSAIPDINVPPKIEKDISTHRYLQLLIKKMAEARGYMAVIEAQVPEGDGQVDVLLTREGKSIAVEICHTTDADWELHNISKCINAGYSTIVSLSGDPKQLEKIKKKCAVSLADFESLPLYFFTPDALFSFLDESIVETQSTETIMKGYRVNVTYDALTKEEMEKKRAAVSQVVLNSLRKRKKKE